MIVMAKQYLNTCWGHIVYRVEKKARWRVPHGMTTLSQFLEWHKRRFNIDQKRRDHPLALEVYYSIVLPRKLTNDEIRTITTELTGELESEFFGDIAKFMEWGYDYEDASEELAGQSEARKRYSRDGEDFTEIDITGAMEIITERLLR